MTEKSASACTTWCLTCRHWDRVDSAPPVNHYFRACAVLNEQAAQGDERVISIPSSKGSPNIVTRDDFGCVYHEEREAR